MSEASTSSAAAPHAARATSRLSPSEWLWLPLVAAGLLVIYMPGLGNSLVFDDAYLTDGLFTDYASLRQLRVRMLSYGSFVWIQQLFGEGWWKQRLFNVTLHAGTVVALWALYRELLRHIASPPDEAPGTAPYYRSPALGAAIGFFALNPVSVYAVAYLIQRSIVMATLFSVLALFLFARALRLRRPALHVLALAAYALAVLAKEYALLVPLAAIPVFIVATRPPPRRLALVAGGVLLLMAAFAAGLHFRYGEILGKPFDEYSQLYLEQLARLNPDAPRHAFALSIINEAWLFFRYGLEWLLPYSGWMSINLRPPFPVHLFAFPQVLGVVGYLAVLAGGFYLLLRYRDGRALVGVSLLMPALLFGTEFATVWVQDPFVLYRSYLWAIGIPGLVFFALHGPSPRVLLLVAGTAGVLLAWQAVDRVLSLANPEVAWSDAIEKLPDDPRSVGRWLPYLNRGSAYAEQNLFELAMRDFETSARLGDQGMGMFNAGAILTAKGRHGEALAALERAQAGGYKLYNLTFQRGLALAGLGRFEEANREFERTLHSNPDRSTGEVALLQFGRTAMQLGKRQEAVESLEQLVKLQPGHKEGRYLLGMALVMKGEAARAREVLDPLAASDPSARVFYARALANYALRRKAEALADIQNAQRLGADTPNLREWEAKIRALPGP